METTWGQIGMEAAQALVPVIGMVVLLLLSLVFAYLRKRLKWLEQTQVDEQVQEMAKGVVIKLQQQLVDDLKAANEDGKLTEEEKNMIRNRAMELLQGQLTEGQRKVLATITADVTAWLEQQIEKALSKHKLEVAAASAGEVLVIEPDPLGAPAAQ